MTTYLQLKGFLPPPISVKERKFNSRTQIWGLFLNLFVGDQGEEAEVGGVGNSTGEGQSILQPSLGPERLRIVCSLGSPSRVWWWTGHLTLGVIEEHAHGVDPRPLASAAEQVRGAPVPGWRVGGPG